MYLGTTNRTYNPVVNTLDGKKKCKLDDGATVTFIADTKKDILTILADGCNKIEKENVGFTKWDKTFFVFPCIQKT